MAGWLRSGRALHPLLRTKRIALNNNSVGSGSSSSASSIFSCSGDGVGGAAGQQPPNSDFSRGNGGSRGSPSSAVVVRLVVLGLASSLPAGVFVITSQVAGVVAGPAVITSLLVAVTAALLSGLCFAEFQSRHPFASSSAYSCCYQTVGEFPAFVVGWSSILQHVALIAASAKTTSAALDYASGGKIGQFLLTKLGAVPWSGGHPPDLVAMAAILLPTAALALGLRHSPWLSYASTAFTLLAAIWFVGVGALYVDYSNWTVEGLLPHLSPGMLNGAAVCSSAFYVSHFAIGASGKSVRRQTLLPITIGVALLLAFVTFFGVTAILTLMVHYRALNSGIALIEAFEIRDVNWARFVMAAAAVFCLFTAMLDWSYPLHRAMCSMSSDGLVFSCLYKKWDVTGTPILSLLACGVIASMLGLIIRITDLLEAMAVAVLLVSTIVCFSVMHQRYQPQDPWQYELITSTAECGHEVRTSAKRKRNKGSAAVQNGSVHCNGESQHEQNGVLDVDNERVDDPLATPVHKPSDSTTPSSGSDSTNNNVYESVALRVPSDTESDDGESTDDTDIDAIVQEYKEKLHVATLTHIEHSDAGNAQREPTDATGKRVSLSLIGLFCCDILLSAIVVYGSGSLAHHASLIVCTCLILILSFVLLSIVYRQPQGTLNPQSPPNGTLYRVPLMPWLPAAAIFINICLLFQLLTTSWLEISLWMVPGFLIYFLYGIHNSTAASHFRHSVSEEQIQLEPLPRQPIVSSLVPSHRKNHNKRRLTEVDTILISR